MRKKLVSFVSLFLIVTIFLTGFATNVEASGYKNLRKIETRGLTFNTGTYSDQILMLKDFFRLKGKKNVPWGYGYDARTKELVREYQRENALNPTGIANGATLKAMNKEILEKGYGLKLRVPETKHKGDMIIINKSSNTLYFLQNGQVRRVFPVATGRNPGMTPSGRHYIKVKLVNPWYAGKIPGGAPNNPLGRRWMGINYGGGSLYGIHGNADPGSIGKYASAGCIRMYNHHVESFYNTVKKSTPVWIGSEGELENYGVKFIYKPGYINVEKKDEYEKLDVKLKIDGKNIDLKKPVLNTRYRNYYPFRELLEYVGAEVGWDQASKTASGTLRGKKVEFPIGAEYYVVNGQKINYPNSDKSFLYKDSTYIPIRHLMEAFDYVVGWDPKEQIIFVDSKEEKPDLEEDENIGEEMPSDLKALLENWEQEKKEEDNKLNKELQ